MNASLKLLSLYALVLLLLAPSLAARAEPAHDSKKWNGGKIEWMDYKSGLAKAKASGKPIFMVVHAEWCPYCKAYRKKFYDRNVEKLAKKFVFVLVDQDRDKRLAKHYTPDGGYIPRSMVLKPNGALDGRLRPSNKAPAFFVDLRRKYSLPTFLRSAAKRYN